MLTNKHEIINALREIDRQLDEHKKFFDKYGGQEVPYSQSLEQLIVFTNELFRARNDYKKLLLEVYGVWYM